MTGLTQRSISSTAGASSVRVGEELRPLVGVLDEREHPARDQVARRLVARHREQQEEDVELEVGELLAVDLGR